MADYADTSTALHDTTVVDFKFTNASETINGSNLTANTQAVAKTLIDGSTTDNDVLNLTLAATPGEILGTSNAFTMQNIETLSVTASNTAALTVDLSIASISGLKTISISGAPTAEVILKGKAAGGFTALGVSKIDASGLTGADAKFTVEATSAAASTGALTIIGGAAADVLTGGSGADVLTGNGASDTFKVGTVAAGNIDKITDFAAWSDKILTPTGATPTPATKYTDKGTFDKSTYATLDDVLATFAATGSNKTIGKEAYSFVYDNKTYVLIDNDTAGAAPGGGDGYDKATDSVVEITGYTGTLTAADFLNA